MITTQYTTLLMFFFFAGAIYKSVAVLPPLFLCSAMRLQNVAVRLASRPQLVSLAVVVTAATVTAVVAGLTAESAELVDHATQTDWIVEPTDGGESGGGPTDIDDGD